MHKKSLRFIVLVCSLLLLSACVRTGPNFSLSTQTGYSFENVKGIEFNNRVNRWWTVFDDTVLNQLIELTLLNNYSLKEAEANVNAAYAVFSNASKDNWPKGNVGIDYSRQNQSVPGFNQDRVDTQSYRTGAELSWSLDLFGKVRYAAESAYASADSQYYLWRDLQVELMAQVAQTYGELKGLKARIIVAQQNIKSLEAMRAITDTRFQAGFASQLDLHRIDAQLYGVKATIPALNATKERAHNTLLTLLGGEESLGEFSIENINQTLPELNKPISIGNPIDLLRRRADLYSSERQLASAAANVNVSIASLYPDLSISGFLGFLSADSSSLGDSRTKAWSIAPSLSWSIFNLSAIHSRIEINKAREQAALARFKQQVLLVLAEAKSSLSDYSDNQKRYHLLSSQTKASSDALNLAKEQYDAGVIDLFELLDVERSLLTAQDNLTQAQVSVFIALVNVYKEFGGGFEFSQLNDKRNVSLNDSSKGK